MKTQTTPLSARPAGAAVLGLHRHASPHLDSAQLVEYLRTGTIHPLAKGDTKLQVEAKLGPPDSWKGQKPDYAWNGPELWDFHDSYAWHYNSLCVTFPDPLLAGLPGISLNYHTEIFGSVRFSPPFTGLPPLNFTIQDLLGMFERHKIHYKDVRPDRIEGIVLVTEGGIAAVSYGGNCTSKAPITYLFPHAFKST